MKTNNFTPCLGKAIQAAATEAQQCGADAITPAHLFLGLMDKTAGFTCAALAAIGVEKEDVREAMHRRYGIYAGHDEEMGLSGASMRALEAAQRMASGGKIDSHHLLVAALYRCGEEPSELTGTLMDAGYSPKNLLTAVQRLLEECCNCPTPDSPDTPRCLGTGLQETDDGSAAACSDTALPETLKQYGKDLTAMAEAGLLDPVVGRDAEIQRAIRTLLRRRKNNPCFVGKAGVGKTALAEGLAQCIADGRAPEQLRDCRIVELNTGTLVAGTKYRGEFEERITGIIREVSADQRIILFFDELHTLLDGSGVESSGISASNILKPALARGDISIIGATTVEEYRKFIEKDPALERRFQRVMVDEPGVEQTITILDNLRERYEDHHGLAIEDEALRAAAELSERYINGRCLPDKAIDVIDEAAAKLQLQGLFRMNEEDVAAVVSEMTGIPVGSISEAEGEKLAGLEARLRSRVIGQDEAVGAVSRAIRRNRAGLKDASRPVGSFLFLGPTGVGKTELSLSLAEALCLHRNALIRLDMSEYMEASSVSKLVGAAPGYVGYDATETLAERVARKPYAVLLFDEIEKAHPDVWNILLQILDTGTLTDSTGREVSFRNAVIIVTSNIGAQHLVSPARSLGFASGPEDGLPREKVLADLKKTFRPELLNRFDEIIVFGKLTMEGTVAIAEKMAGELTDKAGKAGFHLSFTRDAIAALAEKGYDPAYGARPLRRVVQKEVEDELAGLILSGEAERGASIECGFNGAFILRVKNPAKVS